MAVLRKTELGKRVNEMPGTLVSSMCSPDLGSHPVGIAYMCSLLQSSWISQQSKTAVRRWRRRWWDHNIWHTGVEPSPNSGGSFSTQSSLLSTRSLMVIPLLSAWKSWTGTRILIFYLCVHCTKSLGQKSGQNQQMVHSWVCERYEQLELQPPGSRVYFCRRDSLETYTQSPTQLHPPWTSDEPSCSSEKFWT